MSEQTADVFISYARSDGATIAADLQTRLQSEGITVWRDLTDLRGGENWWDQVEQTLCNVRAFILIMTPKAIESHIMALN